MSWYLVISSGPEVGSAFELMGQSVVVGRSNDNDITIDGSTISRHHARLDVKAHTCILTDLGSTNGTWVNDRRISTAVPLRAGDAIRFGRGSVFVLTARPSLDSDRTVVAERMVSPPSPAVPVPPSPSAGGTLVCRACGFRNRPGLRFCEQCAAPLMIPQPVTPVVEEKSVVTQVCRQCGALNSPSLRFCEQCAAQLVPGLPPVEARSRPMQACPRCGRQNPSGLNFCEQCVAPLVAVVPAVPAPSRRRFRLRRWLAVGVAAMLVVAIATVVAVVVGQMPTVTKREAMDIAGGVIEASYPDLIREEPTLRTNKGARETTYSVEYRIEYELQTDAGPATVPGGVIIVVDAESGETQMLGIK